MGEPRTPKKVVGLAWCGTYKCGRLGWVAPRWVDSAPKGLDSEQLKVLSASQRTYYPGDMYRVKVTIEPVKDKNGRYIVKRNRRDSSKPRR